MPREVTLKFDREADGTWYCWVADDPKIVAIAQSKVLAAARVIAKWERERRW